MYPERCKYEQRLGISPLIIFSFEINNIRLDIF